MIGFWIVNLLVPGDPDKLNISALSGSWELRKFVKYSESKNAISNGKCAHTYAIENDVSMDDGAAACDANLNEMTPILLGASYLSGLSVTAKKSLPHSDVLIVRPSDHWPRERAMGVGNYCVSSQEEFVEALEKFIAAWPTTAQSEKILILIHHWLDALGCWSFEDFYLSATTLLQIIAATEERITGNRNLSYLQAIQSASQRVGITSLNRDFKDMRNNLIHEGNLLGGRFSGTDKGACSEVASDLMNWFDEYIHVVMKLGSVKRTRFSNHDFMSLNAYSI
ncbi:MAG: hypothetical protein PVH61_39420 [Candidatus Aminicenantes bacterium]|jgi:hypothetical protein